MSIWLLVNKESILTVSPCKFFLWMKDSKKSKIKNMSISYWYRKDQCLNNWRYLLRLCIMMVLCVMSLLELSKMILKRNWSKFINQNVWSFWEVLFKQQWIEFWREIELERLKISIQITSKNWAVFMINFGKNYRPKWIQIIW